ncbi:hypothetical protein CR194_04360 [Salipaludibacillus keqinensis]|uniref:DUF2178 domain-containing protein n=1 Tax=Salipaludibacillus keqinensis TaxID=2045207 RepID=A0A323TIX7_9BACI|nr:hypothetical protein [Salipaludibacillus keqinensis]PYZ94768.1 hypothetical protein CR194_04360 [Salipaludibacillus keqinensis]
MSTFLDIAGALYPLVIVGAIVIFVIFRMKHKYNKGTLGKKKTEGAQMILDSSIPFGMMIGCIVAILLSLFFPISMVSAIGWGPGIGFLLGYVAYEIYSKQEEGYS